MKKLLIVGLCAVVLGGLTYWDHASGPENMISMQQNEATQVTQSTPKAAPEKQLPDYKLHALADAARMLSDFEGQYVLLNFWATWCFPCIEEMPELFKLADANQGALTVVLVSVDVNTGTVMPFMKRYGFQDGLKAENIFVVTDVRKTLSQAFQAFKYPESYLVGPDRTLVHKFAGKITADDVLPYLKSR